MNASSRVVLVHIAYAFHQMAQQGEEVGIALPHAAEGEVEAASGASQQAEPKVSEETPVVTCACGKPIEECCKTKGTPCEGNCGDCKHDGGHKCKHNGEHQCKHNCKH